MWVPQIIFFIYCMGPSGLFLRLLYGSPSQISVFAYYMGAPSDQFLRLQGSLRPVSLHMPPPPPDQLFCLLCGAPFQISFFAHYMYMRAPQVSFFAYYMGAPQTCFFAYDMGDGPPQISFFACYMGATPPPPLRSVSLRSMHISPPPPRSVFSLTIWGLLQINFFAYYLKAPSYLFLCILYGGPLRSIFSISI